MCEFVADGDCTLGRCFECRVGIGVNPSLVWVGAVGTGFIDCFAYLLVYPEAGQHGGGFHFYRGV